MASNQSNLVEKAIMANTPVPSIEGSSSVDSASPSQSNNIDLLPSPPPSLPSTTALVRVEPTEFAPTEDVCESRHEKMYPTMTATTPTRLAGQTVAPFLAQHIPEYAHLGSNKSPSDIVCPPAQEQSLQSTKYCYRHRPDLKCRRKADEIQMEDLQKVRPFAEYRYSLNNIHLPFTLCLFSCVDAKDR